ncbi:hypothetical protein L1999_03150 [Neobacillus drentensis]|uniref:hypothetical protein n=1 Tax=Neobacillus drentensis TaxID=220684 RepID=UPI001F3AA0EF|nr:hypothetical protein [Neobacillus drentensis]ULT57575.1 hypothetical protein L1999_03150 [Neobacillus drentensis]
MTTNNFDPNLNPTAKKNQEEKLEISSTGYGLESVSKETGETHNKQQTAETNQSCGGL